MTSRNGPRKRAFVALAALAACAQHATADVQEPGSLLLFQEYDNRAGNLTLLTVTNSNAFEDVVVEFIYLARFQQNGAELDCQEFNRSELLTPNDTLTLLTSFHNPNQEQGYVQVFAKNSAGDAISFNHLIGTTLFLDGIDAFDYSVNPVVFESVGSPQGAPTDLNNDGRRDLDGNEYSRGPEEIVFPRFLGQDPSLQSDLVLIDLTGGGGFTTLVEMLIWNDNEELFSAEFEFSCWTRVRLTDISDVFLNNFLQSTNDDPDEILGATHREAGWFRVDGALTSTLEVGIDNPLVLGLLVERTGFRSAAGRPYHIGQQEQGGGNAAPVCNADSAMTLEDLPVDIAVLANDFDPEGELDCGSIAIVAPPANGVVLFSGCAGVGCPTCVATYIPNPGFFGVDQFVYRVSDAQGATTQGCPVTIEVEEVIDPPACPDGVSVELWPPNHQYVELDLGQVAGVVDPNGLPLSIVITSITQDEPINGQGDGNTVCDGTGVGTSVASIRSERRGGGNGRVYYVHYTATNSGGASCSGSFQVTVPHSQNGDPAVDDGQAFDSTEGC